MATFLQKLLLSKNKLCILDAIEQNANEIQYDYREEASYTCHTMTIHTPIVFLSSQLETNMRTKVTLAKYQFTQYDQSGNKVIDESDEATIFADQVHNKMFKAFVERKGTNPIYSKQDIFREKNEKQH